MDAEQQWLSEARCFERLADLLGVTIFACQKANEGAEFVEEWGGDAIYDRMVDEIHSRFSTAMLGFTKLWAERKRLEVILQKHHWWLSDIESANGYAGPLLYRGSNFVANSYCEFTRKAAAEVVSTFEWQLDFFSKQPLCEMEDEIDLQEPDSLLDRWLGLPLRLDVNILVDVFEKVGCFGDYDFDALLESVGRELDRAYEVRFDQDVSSDIPEQPKQKAYVACLTHPDDFTQKCAARLNQLGIPNGKKADAIIALSKEIFPNPVSKEDARTLIRTMAQFERRNRKSD